MKKLITLWICLCSTMMLTACSDSFDPSEYVKGILNNVYLGDSELYQEHVNISEEEAKQEYEDGIQAEVDFLLGIYAIEEISDDLNAQFVDLLKEVYQKSKYEVKDAVQKDQAYSIEVVIYPIDLIKNSITEMDEAVDLVTEKEYADDAELQEAAAQAVLDVLKKNKDSFGYEEPETITVTVYQDSDELWKISDEDFNLMDEAILAYR